MCKMDSVICRIFSLLKIKGKNLVKHDETLLTFFFFVVFHNRISCCNTCSFSHKKLIIFSHCFKINFRQTPLEKKFRFLMLCNKAQTSSY